MKSSVQYLAELSINLTHASGSHHRCEDFIRKPSRTSSCYVHCVNMEVAVFLRSQDRICPDIPLPSTCQVTDLVYFFFKTTLSQGICLWKGSGWSRPFDGIEGQEGREEATCPYFLSGGCPGGLWTSHLPLWKLNFLMIGLSARGQRKQSSWSGKTTQ